MKTIRTVLDAIDKTADDFTKEFDDSPFALLIFVAISLTGLFGTATTAFDLYFHFFPKMESRMWFQILRWSLCIVSPISMPVFYHLLRHSSYRFSDSPDY